MLTAHELIGFMSPKLSAEILEHAFSSDKELYKATLAAVAQARKVRLVFLERQPRAERHVTMLSTLSRPAMEPAAGGLLRGWLLKKHTALLTDFLDALGPEDDAIGGNEIRLLLEHEHHCPAGRDHREGLERCV